MNKSKFITIAKDRRLIQILIDDIICIHDHGNHTMIKTFSGDITTEVPFKKIAQKLIGHRFVSIDEVTLVSTDKITEIEDDILRIDCNELQMKLSYRNRVVDAFLSEKIVYSGEYKPYH